MFLNKKIKTAIFFFSFFISNIFAESSRFISSLTLEFSREETLEQAANSTNKITGKIYYVKNPFLFVFETYKPVPQITFVNDTSAYLIQNNEIIEISDSAEALYQTCNDFLTWFDDDFGLYEESFKPVPISESTIENNQIITPWYYTKKDAHPIDKINVYTSKNGVITRLQMYTDSKTLITDTILEEFEYFTGSVFPKKIISSTFETPQNNDQTIENCGNKLFTTTLSFSNIQFNSNISFQNDIYKSEYQVNQTNKITNDKSIYQNADTSISPAKESFDVSIPQVLLSGSYAFYKKFITNQDMTNCPYYPSCSQYMVQAVSQNGFAGFFQGLERLKRCTSAEHKRNLYPTLANGKHYDPVPEKKNKKDSK